MRSIKVALGACIVALCAMPAMASPIVGAPADPSDPWVFSFDEFGNGLINIDSAGFIPWDGALATDPSSGLGPVLTYSLPALVVAGDVLVYDDDLVTLSDAIRFTDAAGDLTGASADRMIFYSSDIGGGALADTGLPGNLGAGTTGGPVYEDVNGNFTYGNPNSNEYDGASSPEVPEPATLTLLGTGLVAAWRRRRPLNGRA